MPRHGKRRGGDAGIAKLLTDKEVKKLAGPGTEVVTYPELKDAGSLDELFGANKNIILLYLHTREGRNFVGHWVLLTKRTEGAKNIVEFNDSYSNFVDEFFDDVPQAKRAELEQDKGYLSRLLYDWCDDAPENEVHYNEMPLQKEEQDINTCGRWVGLRARFNQIPLKQYQNEFKKAKKAGFDLDKLVTLITDDLLTPKTN